MRLTPFFLLNVVTMFAQQSPDWDTLCYQKFNANLIVGIFQSYRNFDNEFSLPVIRQDSTRVPNHNFSAESRLTTGIEVTYDKFSLALGLQSGPQDGSRNRGNSQTFSYHLRVGGNKWQVENTLRYFRGFYDLNTRQYDSTFLETGRYYFHQGFTNTLLRTKFLYFTNHRRFSVRSGYSCNYRQIKSAASWVLSGNINYNGLGNDSAFIPAATREHYGDEGLIRGLRVIGISANAGGAFSLVLWRSFFIQLLFIVGPEQQWRTYQFPRFSRNLSYLSVSGDFRASIGLNFRRWYFVSFSSNDFVLYNSSFMNISNRSMSGGLIIGYRFNSNVPDFYKKFQQTKLYKLL